MQRWDSCRLNTPGWMNRLLGQQARDAFGDGDGDGDGPGRDRIVVASGDQNLPRVPRLAQALPGRVAQCHTLAGRLVAVAGERVGFDGSAAVNLAAGDAFAARVREMVDNLIDRRGLPVPPPEPDPTDARRRDDAAAEAEALMCSVLLGSGRASLQGCARGAVGGRSKPA
jgi:hypothetical protein